jgi:hypothetical protein
MQVSVGTGRSEKTGDAVMKIITEYQSIAETAVAAGEAIAEGGAVVGAAALL